MVSAATFAGVDRLAGWQFLAVVATVTETVLVEAALENFEINEFH